MSLHRYSHTFTISIHGKDVTNHILSKRTGMHTRVHAIKLEEVTIRSIPPNAGPFPAISAKPYLNSCCHSSITVQIFRMLRSK